MAAYLRNRTCRIFEIRPPPDIIHYRNSLDRCIFDTSMALGFSRKGEEPVKEVSPFVIHILRVQKRDFKPVAGGKIHLKIL